MVLTRVYPTIAMSQIVSGFATEIIRRLKRWANAWSRLNAVEPVAHDLDFSHALDRFMDKSKLCYLFAIPDTVSVSLFVFIFYVVPKQATTDFGTLSRP